MAQSKPFFTKELALRFASSVFLIPVCLGALYQGGIYFELLIGVVGALAVHEFLRMTRVPPIVGVICPLMIGLGAILIEIGPAEWVFPLYAVASVIMTLALPSYQARIYGLMLSLAIWSLIHIPLIDHTLALVLLVIVWATDIGAYFAGRLIGGVKLCPPISPNKTVSGAVGGVVAAVALGGFTLYKVGHSFGLLEGVLLGVVSIVSQIGDLWESYFKRQYQIKDSGTIIPGHGGVLDRVDGLLTAAICWYAMMKTGWI